MRGLHLEKAMEAAPVGIYCSDLFMKMYILASHYPPSVPRMHYYQCIIGHRPLVYWVYGSVQLGASRAVRETIHHSSNTGLIVSANLSNSVYCNFILYITKKCCENIKHCKAISECIFKQFKMYIQSKNVAYISYYSLNRDISRN